MAERDDELLSIFLAESREHLADIETDLLAIEETGADIDEELVNKVFRAAHSIKGGAGFFNLDKIRELSHKTENVLDLIRSRQMSPNPEIINILLLSFDKLAELVNNHEHSNETDIDEFVGSLSRLTESYLPPEEKQTVSEMLEIPLPNGTNTISVSHFDLDRIQKDGKLAYLIEYDMIDDIQRSEKTTLGLLKELQRKGLILGCAMDIEAVGTLDDELTNRIPFYVFYAVDKGSSEIAQFLQVDEDRIFAFHHSEDDAAESPTEVDTQPEPVAHPVMNHPDPTLCHPELVEGPKDEQDEPADIDEPAVGVAPAAKDATANTGSTGRSETSLRVSVNLLESLMNLAGELVLSRNQLVEAISRDDTHLIHASGQRINLVTSELQETIMMTRMQPVGNVLNKFPRIVRDLSRDLKKDIRLDLSGKEVEMDKTIIEGLTDPLTHLVRNAVDHGIETREARVKNGKNPTGTLRISVYHEAGQVIIEISDDGKGIDVHAVAQASLAKGMVSAEQLKTMSESEKLALVLQPGVSTARTVTDVSGRGVGMDVVKTNLDRLGGKVEIESQPGKGTMFRIKLPLTLAIIPSLLISIEGERFAVPQVNVKEMIHVGAEQVKDRIEIVGDAEVLILRGELIPIIELASVLGIGRTYDSVGGDRKPSKRAATADRRSRKREESEHSPEDEPTPRLDHRENSGRRYHADSDLNIVIVSAGALQYGLVVEELHDTVEIVVKPLGRHLKGSHEYAGATIMGDGRVALILDVAGIAEKAGLTSMAATARAQELAEQTQREKLIDTHSFLTFSNGPMEQCAVPLDMVARVEQVQGGRIESVGGKRTMQYRGESLPLVALSDAADAMTLADTDELVVVVFEISGKEIGLLASKPVDVIETRVAVDETTLRQTGVVGSAIINDQTTLIVDIYELVQAAHPEWLATHDRPKQAANNSTTILLAEDSDFFRNQVRKYLEDDDYEVMAAEDGLVAWEALQENPEAISIVVTDIEMPRMDGLGLTQQIRSDPRFSRLPIIALTSLASADDITKGKAVGIDDYQVKLDREKLLQSVRAFLNQSRKAAYRIKEESGNEHAE